MQNYVLDVWDNLCYPIAKLMGGSMGRKATPTEADPQHLENRTQTPRTTRVAAGRDGLAE